VRENPYESPRGQEPKPRSLSMRLLTIGVLILWAVLLPFLVYSAIHFVALARQSAEEDEHRRLQHGLPNSSAPAPNPPKP
jgi:hypothetical protein